MLIRDWQRQIHDCGRTTRYSERMALASRASAGEGLWPAKSRLTAYCLPSLFVALPCRWVNGSRPRTYTARYAGESVSAARRMAWAAHREASSASLAEHRQTSLATIIASTPHSMVKAVPRRHLWRGESDLSGASARSSQAIRRPLRKGSSRCSSGGCAATAPRKALERCAGRVRGRTPSAQGNG